MNIYKYQPINGLLSIDKKEIEGANVLSVLSYVEEKVNSAPVGRAKNLALFLIVINILNKAGLSFYIKGGIVMQYYLGDHSRPSNDIDVVIKEDPDTFYEKVKNALDNYQGELSFKITGHHKNPASEKYLYDSFNIIFHAYYNEQDLGLILLEGVYGDVFDKIKPVTYQGPNFIEEGFTFKGVPIEYVFAEKILAVTSELPRPYKHLVDAYSISKIEIDLNELKRYLVLILEIENIARERFDMNVFIYKYIIRPNKAFTRSFFFAALQAGYSLVEEKMIEELNDYFLQLK